MQGRGAGELGRLGAELRFPQTTADRRLVDTGGSSGLAGLRHGYFYQKGPFQSAAVSPKATLFSLEQLSTVPKHTGCLSKAETLLESEPILTDSPAKGSRGRK